MVATALVLAGIAALVHVFIFYLESVAWTGARARATFGLTEEEAVATRFMAFNQGFYNLFLAIVTAVGIGVVAAGHTAVGSALVLAGPGSMVAAALVLVVTAPDKRAAALKQGVVPLLAVIALVVGLAV